MSPSAVKNTPQHADIMARGINLETLKVLSFEELAALYSQAAMPSSLKDLDGAPEMTILAAPYAHKIPMWGRIRRLQNWRAFPWQGPAFSAVDDANGQGLNRINLTVTQLRTAAFKTRIEPSVVDGLPSVYLDYNIRNNPRVLQSVFAELREVAPNLFLGPCAVEVLGKRIVLLYVAMSTVK